MTELCFDDGPGEFTETVLDTLAAAGAKATFAIVGTMALERPETVRRIVAEGHTLANHTMTHARLTELDPEALAWEIDCCTHTIFEIAGIEPLVLRPPFSAVNQAVEDAASLRGLTLLGTSSAGDYTFDDPNELAHWTQNYPVFLGLHDTHGPTVQALPAILARHR